MRRTAILPSALNLGGVRVEFYFVVDLCTSTLKSAVVEQHFRVSRAQESVPRSYNIVFCSPTWGVDEGHGIID